MNPYNNIKIFNHIDKLISLKRTQHTIPIHINFIISNRCNHNCSFCAYRMSGYPSNQLFNDEKMISFDKATDLLLDFYKLGVKAVQFTGGGEPTVHPKFTKLLEYAQSLKLDTALVTNGHNLNKRNREVLIKSMWVRISLDAGTPEVHSKTRQVSWSSFNKILDNITKLVQLRNEKQSSLYIGVGFVITCENWNTITQAAERVRNTGADSIRYSTLFTNNNIDYYKEFYQDVIAELLKTYKYNTNSFKVIDNFNERYHDLQIGNPKNPQCIQQEISTYVGADLNVYRCCVTAYNKLGYLGSVKDCSMLELWNNPKTIKLLTQFDARRCSRCQFIEKNKIASFIFNSLDSHHVNFI